MDLIGRFQPDSDHVAKFRGGGGDSRVVSVSDFKARGPGFESRWGQRSLVMELVNIYNVLSCSFVEIIRLYVVSVCIN